MRQRALGILGGALVVVGVALGVVTGIGAHSTANPNGLPPASATPGNDRSEGPGPFMGGRPNPPGVRDPDQP